MSEIILTINGHTAEYKGVGVLDTYVCSCGWKSNPYYDGEVWAHEEWVEHAENSKVTQKGDYNDCSDAEST